MFSCIHIDRTYINSSSSSWKKPGPQKSFMKMFFEVGPENGYEKRMMALLHCHLEKIPDVWMIVSELVFSALDISLWIKCPETVVLFASPKKTGHSSVPKGRRIIVLGSQPWTPPPGDFHTARDHFGEISRSRCFLVWELKTLQKTGGPLTMYSTRKLTGWKIQHE